jgi:hypothetical protein
MKKQVPGGKRNGTMMNIAQAKKKSKASAGSRKPAPKKPFIGGSSK